MNIHEAYQKTKTSLSSLYPEDEALAICNELFGQQFGLGPIERIKRDGEPFTSGAELESCMARLLKYEPVQYVTGVADFYGMKLKVTDEVLIPRPETEELLQWVKESCKTTPDLIADICTGSGCLALGLRSIFKQSAVIAMDISEAALMLAAENEIAVFGSNHIHFHLHDILNTAWKFQVPDLVVCNPPYVLASEKEMMDQNVLNYEPHLALFVEDYDPLLFYKAVLETFSGIKMPMVYFELNPLTATEFSVYCKNSGFSYTIKNDLFGKQRFACISE